MTSTQKLLGSSIVRYILTHSSNLYTVRAVTRNPESSKARALAALGAEVVQGDFDDEDSIRQALAGVQILFHNTDFWTTMSDDAEAAQSLTVAKVTAAEPNLEHVVLSTLSDPTTLFQGKYMHNLPYNGKFKAERMIKKEYPELWAKTTRLLVALYHSNWFLPPFSPVKTDSGQLELQNPYSPSSRIPSASPDDTGVVVDAIIRGGQKYHGRTVSIWSEWISDEEKLKVWGHVLGVKAAFKQVTPIEYQQRLESIGFPPYLAQGCLELLSMLGEGVNYVTGGEIIDARTIVDPSYHFKTWEEYVKEVNWTSIL
ncbi:hypothetical protein BGW36DRAFT_434124 [Talaromyces proteolyticus]|uniref:NmrA-like domain-containing protein n=1 Tax=Talaromyces proteolyticus TaxID=1131652 RepID=A0AAD4PU28_9EURO|nr:uncharacterized protein BGW36DRAFT_434124 [Talaromyces proteolyticus]KAH8688834.1 hypothetical protein BGW36DRAFT_434124 [Talaromyces proteolyticus]